MSCYCVLASKSTNGKVFNILTWKRTKEIKNLVHNEYFVFVRHKILLGGKQ